MFERPAGESPVICFLDESATDDTQLDDAVLGGIVINRSFTFPFIHEWDRLLRKFGAESGLHMIEMGPDGKLAHLSDSERVQLLTCAVRLINEMRIFTFGACLSNRQYEGLVSGYMRRKQTSVYFAAFLMAIIINSDSARLQGYEKPIDYVLDSGNRFQRHVKDAGVGLATADEMKPYQVGCVEFSTDSRQALLQAADVIAWATRRRRAQQSFRHHLPIEGLFDQFYCESPIPPKVLEELTRVFARAEKRFKAEKSVRRGIHASAQRQHPQGRT